MDSGTCAGIYRWELGRHLIQDSALLAFSSSWGQAIRRSREIPTL